VHAIDADDGGGADERLSTGLAENGEVGSDGHRVLFLHAAHLHTKVLCFYYDHYSQRIKRMLDAVFNLRRQTLLHL
jgi:hypothetical protein